MPSANRGGWKPVPVATSTEDPAVVSSDGRETAPPAVDARGRNDDLDPCIARFGYAFYLQNFGEVRRLAYLRKLG